MLQGLRRIGARARIRNLGCVVGVRLGVSSSPVADPSPKLVDDTALEDPEADSPNVLVTDFCTGALCQPVHQAGSRVLHQIRVLRGQ